MRIADTSVISDDSPIPYGRHEIDGGDIAAVEAVLRSEFLTQGPVVPHFEKALAERVGASHAVASNSATSSLHLACLALGVGAGDLVWTSPVTFVASANCARYCGADVDFVDIDPRSYNMSVERLGEKLAKAKRAGRLPKVVIPVHLAGHPADMEAIAGLSRRYGFSVVEDASHAIGGTHRGEPVGSCQHSDVTVFSFHPVKIITTAEGGMAVTNNAKLARRMARLNSHGITRDPAEMTGPSDGPWYYQQVELGFNYRMTEMQAALGLSQMTRLDGFVERRHALAERYDRILADLPVTTPWRRSGDRSAFHLYIVRLGRADAFVSHREVFERMRAAGILVNLHYIPIYRQPDFARFGFRVSDFPEAERYYAEAITLPLYPNLSEEDQDRIIEALRGCLA